MNKKLVRLATLLFVLTVVIITFIHSLTKGFHMNWSISRYMGSEPWSAILFCLSNFVVIALVLKYLYGVKKEHHLSTIWWILVLLMVVCYVMLSIFPVGLFDKMWGRFGTVSSIHQCSAYILFLMMILITAVTMYEVKKGTIMHVFGASAIVLSLGVVAGFLFGVVFFTEHMYILESGYVLLNLVFYSLIPRGTIEEN